ncbi:TetR/AcrR family transcriptional regulator [Antrihabitans sp. YC2-6]|uniref:TetR/AcrR family transcriptional regulator n=1 Tax=Antrihabitans sp. YC2-6 TaxID=2799498 RepID=UPI0018F3CCC1|nr:TetR/AcrR family transcriptional regulator [Antrihabitans sp. YC2-6]MBJ8344901.1 TetR/AcrR family transcriptional regulator [Antrihabitans sp. YC2-6]
MAEQHGEQMGRSATKRRSILTTARTLFLHKGFDGVSMDEVAALAAVSKQTVYKQFSDKKSLFVAVVTGDINETEALTHDMVAALAGSTDLAEDLREFARHHVVEVTRPHLIALRRIMIAEAERFPELAKTWYASGPERAHAAFAELFEGLHRRGLLRVDDPDLAAQHFNWLILSTPLNKAMFDATVQFTAHELHRYADEGVRVFLAAYEAA